MIDLPGMAEVWALLPEARVAGGAVRDMLAGREVSDVDFAAPLPPDEVMGRARAAGVKAVPTGIAHGTVTLVVGGHGFEVTSLRRDVETDGRRAVVEFTGDWREDAARRDFTINAMSMDRGGAVFDYFGGREDLAAGRVRFVGDPYERIKEDYLRVLRFFRFYARYGRGEPDAEAMAAIAALKDGVSGLSAERVWSEIKQILKTRDPVPALELMREAGVLALVLPGADLERLRRLVEGGAPADPLLRVAALVTENREEFAARLRLSNGERERLEALCMHNALRPGDGDDVLRCALAVTPASVLVDRTWLACGFGVEWDGLRTRLEAMERPVFPVQGRDVTALGIPAGPGVGEILRAAHDWWMAGGCVADRDACLAFVRQRS